MRLRRDDVRCRLKEQNPGKGPDHEVSSVQWIHQANVPDVRQALVAFVTVPVCLRAVFASLPARKFAVRSGIIMHVNI